MTWPCPRLASVWPETEDIRSLPDSWEDQSRAIRLRGSGDTGGCEHTAVHPWISPYLSCSQVQLFLLHLGKLSPQRSLVQSPMTFQRQRLSPHSSLAS